MVVRDREFKHTTVRVEPLRCTRKHFSRVDSKEGRERGTTGTEGRRGIMSQEKRRQYLLRAALRAERDGDYRVARSLRRMADDILPIDRARTLALDKLPA
jgi:hypothetical protein